MFNIFINKEVDYACRIIIFLHKNNNRLIKKYQISEEEKIPLRFLTNILKKISKNEIIGSGKGCKGGYFLNKKLSEISLWTIIEAITGNIYIKDCLNDSIGICDVRTGKCLIHEEFKAIDLEIKKKFKKKSLEDILANKHNFKK